MSRSGLCYGWVLALHICTICVSVQSAAAVWHVVSRDPSPPAYPPLPISTSSPPPSPSPSPSPPAADASNQPTPGLPRIHYDDDAIMALDGIALPSCVMAPISGTCEPTNNFLLQKPFSYTDASYGARALAFLVATNSYCGQFPRKSPNCSKYPCADNGEACVAAGPVQYGIYTCPGSKAATDTYCTEAPAANSSLCQATPGCSYEPKAASHPAACIATFKQNLTGAAYSQYLSDWGTTRRDVWGCCDASEAKWMNDVYCDRFSSSQERCANTTGCIFSDSGTCSWSPSFWIASNFAPSKEAQDLTSIAQQCAMHTNARTCNAQAPVHVNASVVKSILSFDLSAINNAVNGTNCIVWTSEQ